MKIALIDFKDSFTFNIAHYIESEGVEVQVLQDEFLDVATLIDFDKIILSPGPGLPKEKKSMQLILEKYHAVKPILGICLGMQGIVEFFGGTIYNQEEVKHGVQTKIFKLDTSMLFKNLIFPFNVGLYHSWACDVNLSKELIPTSISEDKILMSIEHISLPIYAVQFHPESILSENGKEIVRNFLYL